MARVPWVCRCVDCVVSGARVGCGDVGVLWLVVVVHRLLRGCCVFPCWWGCWRLSSLVVVEEEVSLWSEEELCLGGRLWW